MPEVIKWISIGPIATACAAGYLTYLLVNSKASLSEGPHCVATCDSIVPLQYTDYNEAASASSGSDCFRDVTLQLDNILGWGVYWSSSYIGFMLSLAWLYFHLAFKDEPVLPGVSVFLFFVSTISTFFPFVIRGLTLDLSDDAKICQGHLAYKNLDAETQAFYERDGIWTLNFALIAMLGLPFVLVMFMMLGAFIM